MSKPLHLRRIKADMAIRDVSLTALSKKARINLSVASDLLNGRRIDPARLERLSAALRKFPTPEEATV